MEDCAIIDLYWSRNPEAISRTCEKYGNYCRAVARNILPDRRDTEECVNDTWLKAWNAMPEDRPGLLAQYLGKITRNLALSRWRANRTEKRGGGELPLHALPERECNLFLRRYWFAEPTAEIARRYGMRENTVRTILFRSRKKLQSYLEKEELL